MGRARTPRALRNDDRILPARWTFHECMLSLGCPAPHLLVRPSKTLRCCCVLLRSEIEWAPAKVICCSMRGTGLQENLSNRSAIVRCTRTSARTGQLNLHWAEVGLLQNGLLARVTVRSRIHSLAAEGVMHIRDAIIMRYRPPWFYRATPSRTLNWRPSNPPPARRLRARVLTGYGYSRPRVGHACSETP